MKKATTHEKFMKQALLQAQKARQKEEVPIGAVIVCQGKVIARAYNKRQQSRNAIEHAEILAISQACKKIGDWRLNGCDIYVTLEPCAMCAGACINARIDNIYFGAYESKSGCCGSAVDLPSVFHPNHTSNTTGGILEKECSQILTEYFQSKRS